MQDMNVLVKPVIGEGTRANLIEQIDAATTGGIPLKLEPKMKEMSTAELATLASQLTPAPVEFKITPKLDQTDIDTLFSAIDATVPKEAAKQFDELNQKIEGTGKTVLLYQGDFSGWKDTTYNLGENAKAAAKEVGALNTQLKNVPKNIDVKINISTSNTGRQKSKGGEDKPGKAAGGPVYANMPYYVGERGRELFI